MKVYRPTDYGARGSGADDTTALHAMFAAVMADGRSCSVDMSGSWVISEPVDIMAPPDSDLIAGTFTVSPDVRLETALTLSLNKCYMRGILRLSGRETSHYVHRNVVDGIDIHEANASVFDGFSCKYVTRYGVRNAKRPGSNSIGAKLGHIRGFFCGAPGHPGAPTHTRLMGQVLHIERVGKAGSFVQSAVLTLRDGVLLQPGDYVTVGGRPFVGGHLCEVLSVGEKTVTVYPWPGPLQGFGDWGLEGVVGGAVLLQGGNTAQLSISGLYAQHCGHGLHSTGLYGCQASGVMAEVCGSAVTIGAMRAATIGTNIIGLHGEATLVDILCGGLSPRRVVITGPTEPITPGENSHHVKPTLESGLPSSFKWPILSVPETTFEVVA
jgi:hypothetical protein